MWGLQMKNRKFDLWYYTVSHRMMLLRSAGSGAQPNLDLIFTDVSYLEMPSELKGLTVAEPTPEEMEYLRERAAEKPETVTVLVSGEKRYFVISARMKIAENHLHPLELPFDIPCDMGGIFRRGGEPAKGGESPQA